MNASREVEDDPRAKSRTIPERCRGRSPSEVEGGGNRTPTNIPASTALGHRHHSYERAGLGCARPGAQTERSRGTTAPRSRGPISESLACELNAPHPPNTYYLSPNAFPFLPYLCTLKCKNTIPLYSHSAMAFASCINTCLAKWLTAV